MQKKLIALAVAGLASTAAFAQTNVTIYGLVDYGYAYRFDGRGLDSTTNLINNAGKPNSASQLNGGQQSGNRLGFKGTEDLGNGLKAVFLLEQGFQLDTGASASTSSFYNRQAYAGLSGGFGTVVGGRLYTPHYTFVSGLDPFGAGTVGRYNNVYSVVAGAVPGSAFGNLTDPVRVDNALAYISPSFGGFTVTGAFSNNASGDDSTSNNARNNTVYAVLGQYDWWRAEAWCQLPLHRRRHRPASRSTTSRTSRWAARLTSRLPRSWRCTPGTTIDNSHWPPSRTSRSTTTCWAPRFRSASSLPRVPTSTLTATPPLGDAQQLALGLDYNLSKRTNFYTAYSWIDNSEQPYERRGRCANAGTYAGAGYGR